VIGSSVVACCTVRLYQFDLRAHVQYSRGEWSGKHWFALVCGVTGVKPMENYCYIDLRKSLREYVPSLTNTKCLGRGINAYATVVSYTRKNNKKTNDTNHREGIIQGAPCWPLRICASAL
jgi:hypothetical protein